MILNGIRHLVIFMTQCDELSWPGRIGPPKATSAPSRGRLVDRARRATTREQWSVGSLRCDLGPEDAQDQVSMKKAGPTPLQPSAA
jgi:hypothetical protein